MLLGPPLEYAARVRGQLQQAALLFAPCLFATKTLHRTPRIFRAISKAARALWVWAPPRGVSTMAIAWPIVAHSTEARGLALLTAGPQKHGRRVPDGDVLRKRSRRVGALAGLFVCV